MDPNGVTTPIKKIQIAEKFADQYHQESGQVILQAFPQF